MFWKRGGAGPRSYEHVVRLPHAGAFVDRRCWAAVEVRYDVGVSARRTPPSPCATSAHASAVMSGNTRSDTKPEIAVRSLLHRRGMRFRKDLFVRVGLVRTFVDIAFTGARLAVYVDGCFWHACPDHMVLPKSNLEYWLPKLDGNRSRDLRVNAGLTSVGWKVVRYWTHYSAAEVADDVESVLLSMTQDVSDH